MHFLSVPGNDYVLTSGANWPLRDSGRSSRNREETMTTETKPATFREWFKQNLAEDYGRDIANHGADAGYPHITTADTVLSCSTNTARKSGRWPSRKRKAWAARMLPK
jgi:hypothetical protein